MLEVTQETDVYTARDEHVGSVDRIVIDPVSGRVSHVVVRKGLFFPEDKLIQMEDISTATPERINLRQGVVADELLPFVEQHYVPFDEADIEEADRPARLIDGGTGFVSTWYGPLGVAAPMHESTLLAVSERNIPDRLTALQAGVPVFSSDRQVVGRLDRVDHHERRTSDPFRHRGGGALVRSPRGAHRVGGRHHRRSGRSRCHGSRHRGASAARPRRLTRSPAGGVRVATGELWM